MRYFTLTDAERALVLIRPIVNDILEKRRKLLRIRQHAQNIQTQRLHGADMVQQQRFQHDVRKLIEEISHHLDEIAQVGCVLKDLNRGLVDFPSWYSGREVLLCWRAGEKHIRFWHECNTGYSMRREVDDTFRPNSELLPSV